MTRHRQAVRPSRIAAATCLLALVVMAAYVARYRGDPGVLTAMSGHWADCVGNLPANLPVYREYGGSDGSYNFSVAQDPFLQRPYPDCASAAMRYTSTRWLYPVTSWVLAAGNDSWLKFTMPLANIAFLFLFALFAARLLQHQGRSLEWVVPCCLTAGIWQTLRFNLVDLSFVAMAAGALYYFRRDRLVPALGFLAAAMLARDVAVVIALVFACETLTVRRDARRAALFLLPLVAYMALFRTWLDARIVAESPRTFDLTVPLLVPATQIYDLVRARALPHVALAGAALLFLLIMAALAVRRIVRTRMLEVEPVLVLGLVVGALSFRQAAWSTGLIQMTRPVALAIPLLPLLMFRGDARLSKLILWMVVIVSAVGAFWVLLSPQMR